MSGTGQPVTVVVNDGVSPQISVKLKQIAVDARDADDAVARLQAQLSGLGSAAAATVKLAQAANTNATAQIKAAQAVDAAALSAARLEKAQASAAAATAKAGTAYLQQEAALNRAVVAESAAAKASEDKTAAMIAEARATQFAAAAQAEFNAMLGVGASSGKSASNSAAVFIADAQAQALAAKQSKALADAEKQQAAAQAAAQAPANNFIKSLEQQAATLNMTKSETLAYRAAQLGVTAEAAPHIAALKGIEDAAAGGGINMATFARETAVAGREIARGNFSRLAGSLTILIGSLGEAAIAIAAVTAPLIIFGVASLKGEEEVTQLNNSLKVTGQTAGYTAGQIMQMEQQVAQGAQVHIGVARDAFEELTKSGKFSGQTFQLVGQASVDMSKLTGESAQKWASDFDRMSDGVVKFAEEYASTYADKITPAQLEHLKQTEANFGTEKAEQEFMLDILPKLAKQTQDSLGTMESVWNDLTGAISGAWEAMKNFGKDTPELNVQRDKATLAALQEQLNNPQIAKRGGFVDPVQTQALKDQIAAAQIALHVDELTVNMSEKKAAAAGKESAANRQLIEDHKTLDEAGATLIKGPDLAAAHWKVVQEAIDRATKAHQAYIVEAGKQIPLTPANIASMKQQNDKKYDPADYKADQQAAALAEKKTLALGAFNLKIQDEIARLQELKPIRDADAQLDALEVSMYGKKIPLSAAMKASLTAEVMEMERQKEIAADTDKLYDKLIKPALDYKNTLDAIAAAMKNTDKNKLTLTPAQGSAATIGATQTFKEATDASYIYTQSLKQQQAALQFVGPSQQAYNEVLNVYRASITALHPLNAQQITDLVQQTLTLEKSKLVNQELATIYNQTVGEMERLTASMTALDQSYAKGLIGSQEYKASLALLGTEFTDLKIKMGNASFSDMFTSSVLKATNATENLSKTISDDMTNLFSTMEDQFASTVSKIALGQENLAQGFRDIAEAIASDLIQALVKLAVQWVVQATIGDALAVSSAAASSAAGAGVAASWAPAAIAASIATFGAADVAGGAAYATALAAGTALTTGLAAVPKADGGIITGPGGPRDDKVLIAASNGEFVVNARATQQHRALLEMLNGNLTPSLKFADGGAIGGQPQGYIGGKIVIGSQSPVIPTVTIENHGTPQTYAVKSWSEGELRLIARDEANKTTSKMTPKIVAGQINDANSTVSRTLGNKTTALRRRN